VNAYYYSTGNGRELYFETMPVSIAHVDQRASKLVAKGRKQIWDGDGNRVRHDIGRWAFVAARPDRRPAGRQVQNRGDAFRPCAP